MDLAAELELGEGPLAAALRGVAIEVVRAARGGEGEARGEAGAVLDALLGKEEVEGAKWGGWGVATTARGAGLCRAVLG